MNPSLHRPRSFYALGKRLVILALGLILVIVLAILSAFAWVDRQEAAYRAVASSGYRDITVGDWYPGCPANQVGSLFTAREPDGLLVEGRICEDGRRSVIVLKYPLYHRLGPVTTN